MQSSILSLITAGIILFLTAISCTPPERKLTKTEKLYMRAELFEKLAKYDKAILCVDSLLLYNPSNYPLMNTKGWLYYMNSDKENAIKTFNTIIQKDSSYLVPFYSLAELHAREGEFEKAQAFYNRAEPPYYLVNIFAMYNSNEHEPVDKTDIYYWQGYVSYKLGNYFRAHEKLNSAIASNSMFTEEAYLLKGEAYLKEGQTNEACEMFKQISAKNKKAQEYMEKYCK